MAKQYFRVLYVKDRPDWKDSHPTWSVPMSLEKAKDLFQIFPDAFEIVEIKAARMPLKRPKENVLG